MNNARPSSYACPASTEFKPVQCEKMVKPRVKKTTRGEIPQELYEQAAYDVINGNAKVRTTAKKYGMCLFLSGDLLLLRRIIKPTSWLSSA
ncbi:hypothetical protein JTB14_005679 [Gonioctena quinquepunctata]|nr:hypothetical protein JTB14_005679 [Gonioctena quinquepunctata]